MTRHVDHKTIVRKLAQVSHGNQQVQGSPTSSKSYPKPKDGHTLDGNRHELTNDLLAYQQGPEKFKKSFALASEHRYKPMKGLARGSDASRWIEHNSIYKRWGEDKFPVCEDCRQSGTAAAHGRAQDDQGIAPSTPEHSSQTPRNNSPLIVVPLIGSYGIEEQMEAKTKRTQELLDEHNALSEWDVVGDDLEDITSTGSVVGHDESRTSAAAVGRDVDDFGMWMETDLRY